MCNNIVCLLKAVKDQIGQSVKNFKNFEIHLYFVWQLTYCCDNDIIMSLQVPNIHSDACFPAYILSYSNPIGDYMFSTTISSY